jgi:hypothetical protein
MTLSDLASIGNLISGVAVVISLIYLSAQTRQNSRHSQALIQQGRASRTMEILTRWAEFNWTDGMEACISGSPEVNPRDLRRFISLMRAYFVNYEDSFLQHSQGLLDDAAFANVEAALRTTMTGPGHRAAWHVARDAFDRAFQDYMDAIIARTSAAPTTLAVERWKAATTPAHAAATG